MSIPQELLSRGKEAMRMWSNKEGWFILDKGVLKFFENLRDAWMYVFLMKEIRPNPRKTYHDLYPVRTLDPRPSFKGKKVTIL
jgi:hypothetical protein